MAWGTAFFRLVAIAAVLFLSGGANAQARLKVVATIKPVHSIAAAVMEGVAEPRLLLEGAASPHSYALKPSDAQALSEADVVIRVSENLEVFLNKALETLPEKARIVTLENAPGLNLLPVRGGAAFEAHEHGDADHESHASDGEHEQAGHGHEHEHGEGDAGRDVHFWLDPANGARIADYIAAELALAAPEHAGRFKDNAAALKAKLAALDDELRARLSPVSGRPFIVFHDVMQYFEKRYGLKAAGAVTVSPERQPGAKRLSALRERIAGLGAVCVFAEPQFPPKLVDTITEGTRARKGTLDEIGVELPAGPGQYEALLRSNAESLAECLTGGAS